MGCEGDSDSAPVPSAHGGGQKQREVTRRKASAGRGVIQGVSLVMGQPPRPPGTLGPWMA